MLKRVEEWPEPPEDNVPTINWIIEDFSPDNGYDKLAAEAIRQGIDCDVYNTNDPSVEFDRGKYLVFGGKPIYTLVQSSFQFVEQNGLSGFYPYNQMFTPDNYLCTNYYKFFTKYLLNDKYVIMTVSETARNIDFLESILGEKESGRIFIRPNSGLKPITGAVFINRHPHFMIDWGYVKHSMREDDLLIIAPPKQIKTEWRVVVIDGKPITASKYRTGGFIDYELVDFKKNLRLFIFAEKMISLYTPDVTYTMDIAEDERGDYKLLELNSFPHAGLYQCDMSKIVTAIKELVIKLRTER